MAVDIFLVYSLDLGDETGEGAPLECAGDNRVAGRIGTGVLTALVLLRSVLVPGFWNRREEGGGVEELTASRKIYSSEDSWSAPSENALTIWTLSFPNSLAVACCSCLRNCWG